MKKNEFIDNVTFKSGIHDNGRIYQYKAGDHDSGHIIELSKDFLYPGEWRSEHECNIDKITDRGIHCYTSICGGVIYIFIPFGKMIITENPFINQKNY